MKPYYEHDGITLFHGDCRDLLSEVSAEVMVTDPPYGIDYRSGFASATLARSIAGDKDSSLRDAVLAWWGDRPALVFGSWRIPRPQGTRMVLIYDKGGALGMGDLSLPWKPSHEEIYVLGSGFSGRRDSNIIQGRTQSTASKGRFHPHEKDHRALASLLLKCPPGTVIDPFCGSGSTLVAAKSLRRKAIGIEIDERHCEVAVRRLRQEVMF